MELRSLRYFVVLGEHLNFSKAALALHITQPTLSAQIRALERELGFFLFQRDTHKVSLSPAGERFLPAACRLMEEYEKLTQEAQNICGTLRNSITFGTSTMSFPRVAPCIPVFQDQYPHVDLNLVESDNDPALVNAVREHKVDVALVCLPEGTSMEGLSIFPVEKEHIRVILSARHPLAQREFLTLEDISGEKLIFSSPRSGLRNLILHKLRQSGLPAIENVNVSLADGRVPLLQQNTITFERNRHNMWSVWMRQKNVVSIPIRPYIYTTFALISAEDIPPSFIIKMFISVLSRELRRLSEQTSEQ